MQFLRLSLNLDRQQLETREFVGWGKLGARFAGTLVLGNLDQRLVHLAFLGIGPGYRIAVGILVRKHQAVAEIGIMRNQQHVHAVLPALFSKLPEVLGLRGIQ